MLGKVAMVVGKVAVFGGVTRGTVGGGVVMRVGKRVGAGVGLGVLGMGMVGRCVGCRFSCDRVGCGVGCIVHAADGVVTWANST